MKTKQPVVKFAVKYNYQSDDSTNGRYNSEGDYDTLEAARQHLTDLRGGKAGQLPAPYVRKPFPGFYDRSQLVAECYSCEAHDDHCEVVAWVSYRWAKKHDAELDVLSAKVLAEMGGEIKC